MAKYQTDLIQVLATLGSNSALNTDRKNSLDDGDLDMEVTVEGEESGAREVRTQTPVTEVRVVTSPLLGNGTQSDK